MGKFDSIVDGFGKTGSVCNGGCRLDGVSVSVLESFHHDNTKLAASKSSLFAFLALAYSQKEKNGRDVQYDEMVFEQDLV